MRLPTKMWLCFGVVWFGAQLLDYFIPPANPTFNAALAMMSALACFARHYERVTADD